MTQLCTLVSSKAQTEEDDDVLLVKRSFYSGVLFFIDESESFEGWAC